jgi:Arylsulfotransferase (ASST)
MDETDGRGGKPKATNEPLSRIDRFFRTASLTALVALAFLGGSVFTLGEIFPGPQIARAYEGGKALYAQLTVYQDVFKSDLWAPERRPGEGVTVHVPGRAQEGVTLYTSGNEPAAFLIDMDGKVVHEWRRPFSTVWRPQSGGVKKPRPDAYVYFRNVYPYPNGDLLVVYEGAGDTPYGYGVAKLDRDSNLIWSYPGRAHHQLSVAPDGRIYALTHEIVEDKVEGVDYLKRPRLEDFLVVLSPDGKELRKIRLLTALNQSKYQHLIHRMPSFALADPLHANSVKYIDGKAAKNFTIGKEGQVLLSFRENSSIAILDPATEKVTWATPGPWIGQHDPDILPNGNIILFDNYGSYGKPEELSRVIEFDPHTMKIVWQYAGTPGNPLGSEIRGNQQRLQNGNTLINESNGGRVVEVTPEGQIVWEFVNPVRGEDKGNRKIPVIAWAQRLGASFFDVPLLAARQRDAPSQTEVHL